MINQKILWFFPRIITVNGLPPCWSSPSVPEYQFPNPSSWEWGGNLHTDQSVESSADCARLTRGWESGNGAEVTGFDAVEEMVRAAVARVCLQKCSRWALWRRSKVSTFLMETETNFPLKSLIVNYVKMFANWNWFTDGFNWTN